MQNPGKAIESLDIDMACSGKPTGDIKKMTAGEALDMGIEGGDLDERQFDKYELEDREKAKGCIEGKDRRRGRSKPEDRLPGGP
jgi:hypothetical protein